MSKNFATDMLGQRGILIGVVFGGAATVGALAQGDFLLAGAFAIGGVIMILLGVYTLKINR